MTKLPEEIIDVLKDPATIKFLVTNDENNVPHIVYKQSLTALDADFIAYMEFLETSNTQKNMLRSLWGKKIISIGIFNPKTNLSYQIKGEPYKFLEDGPIWDQFLEKVWREMPDVDPAGVWIIKPKEVINHNFTLRREEEEKRFIPSFSFWMRYLGRRS
jgi:hypothetical protein